jgi:flagellar hook protein FlgE
MMRSMYSGVSGLRNHQIKMDVIGNNIANVNTVGFKKSTVVFKDALYQAYRGATSPTANCGGTNPMGVGLGMTVAAVQQMHATSSTMNTENTTDMAIDGNGYFLLKNGNQEYYTRAGSFIFDEWGNLVSNSNGYRVCGWTADKAAWNEEGYTIDTTADAEPIDISDLKTLQPVASTQVDFSGNLSSSNTTITDLASAVPPFTVASLFGATPAASSVIDDFPIGEDDYNNQVVLTSKVYDSLGNSVNVYYKFFKTNADSTGAAGTTWHCDVSLDPEFGGTVTLASAAAGAADAIPSGGVLRIADLIKFDSAGKTRLLRPSKI